MTKRIVINADDFGRSLERNIAIDEAFKEGLIDSAAIIINTDYTQDAIEKAKRGGYLCKLHCHFNIAGCKYGGYGKPLSSKIKECHAFCNNDGTFRAYGDYDRSNTIFLTYSDIIYEELEAQYEKFIELTQGKANNNHVDFHLWDNQRLPVAAALGRFLRKHKIHRCRFVGVHQHYSGLKQFVRYALTRVLSFSPYTKGHISTRINYFLHRNQEFTSNLIEMYIHPDIVDGTIIDNTMPIFGDKKYSLKEHIQLLEQYQFQRVSWETLDNNL